MDTQGFRYVLDLARAKDDASLGQHLLQPDFAPAVEWARFRALQTWFDPERAAAAEISIQPQWHVQSGAPYVESVRVTARAHGVPAVSAVLPISYFKQQALRIANRLIGSKQMQAGEQFTYAMLAFPEPAETPRSPGDGIEVEELPVSVDLRSGSLAALMATSTAYGEADAELTPVFVSSRVIAEVAALTQEANEMEVGSILIGHLRKDAEARTIFLEVTAQIPARHTLSETAKLSFTLETWAAAQAAIALRHSGEQMVGWFHSHPARYWCNKECSPEAKQQCPLGKSFFSSADCDLQRTCFLPPYCVALLVTHSFTGMKLAMFSWYQAAIAQRGFYVINPDGAAQPLPAADGAPSIGDPQHEATCHTEPTHH